MSPEMHIIDATDSVYWSTFYLIACAIGIKRCLGNSSADLERIFNPNERVGLNLFMIGSAGKNNYVNTHSHRFWVAG